MSSALASPATVPLTGSRRWLCLAVVVAAQFMFVLDAFIVNVAIPSIRADLGMTEAGIEAVIVLYQIAFATLVITGGRLGDLRGRKAMFLLGLLGFTAASLWCGLARSGAELIAARLAQGASAALMSPQVLATIHTLFPDAAPRDGTRPRAFAVFGVALGLGGAMGFLLGGGLLTLNLFGLGWRMIFFVNVPVGLALAFAAGRLLPPSPARPDQRLDLPGAVFLFLGLLALIGPILCGRSLGWPWWLLVVAADGVATLALFLLWERRTERRGGQPLIDLALLSDRAFRRGLLAAVCFFEANMSFYLVLTLYLQNGLGLAPFEAGVSVLPLALAFVIGSRAGGDLIRGCLLQTAGMIATGAVIAFWPASPGQASGVVPLLFPLALFGYGQGRVMAPLFGAILAGVRHAHAGAGAGILTTTQQGANAAGVALVGLVYFTVAEHGGDRAAILAALVPLCVLVLGTAASLRWMRRAG